MNADNKQVTLWKKCPTEDLFQRTFPSWWQIMHCLRRHIPAPSAGRYGTTIFFDANRNLFILVLKIRLCLHTLRMKLVSDAIMGSYWPKPQLLA